MYVKLVFSQKELLKLIGEMEDKISSYSQNIKIHAHQGSKLSDTKKSSNLSDIDMEKLENSENKQDI